MIKLKTEVNKSAIMRELQEKATEGFKDSWQPELQVQAYMNGVHDLFKLLRLGDVVVPKGTCCGKTRANNQFLKRPSKYCLECGEEL